MDKYKDVEVNFNFLLFNHFSESEVQPETRLSFRPSASLGSHLAGLVQILNAALAARWSCARIRDKSDKKLLAN